MVVKVNKGGTNAADEYISELERELAGTQEMLAFVLKAIGEPVEVTKETINEGLGDVQIHVDDDLQKDVFTFSLVEAE